nr:DUF4214 domain-containing protein [Pseudomonas luteola]
MTLASIAQNWMQYQPETQAKYPASQSQSDFIQQIYQNVLGRTAESDGLTYWQEQLQSGNVSRDVFIAAIINGAKSNTSEQGKLDAALLSNKADAGLAFADKELNDVTLANKVLSTINSDAASLKGALAIIKLAPSNPSADQITALSNVLDNMKALITQSPSALNNAAIYLEAVASQAGSAELSSLLTNIGSLISSAVKSPTALNNPEALANATIEHSHGSSGSSSGGSSAGGGSAAVDNIAPHMVSAEVSANGLEIKITYSEALKGSIEAEDFSLSGLAAVTSSTVTKDAAGKDTLVTLTLDQPIAKDANVSITYNPAAGTELTGLKDAVGNVAKTESLSSAITNNSLVEVETPIVGVAQDGYLRGATVFMDMDGDGALDEDEPQTVTDYSGNFTLYGGKGGSIIAFGGTDISTGLANAGVFKAPAGSTVVNPLTTLVAELAGGNEASAIAAAQIKVLAALNLPSDFNLTQADPLATALSDTSTAEQKADALQVQATSIQVANLISAVTQMFSDSAGGSTDTVLAQQVAKSISQTIEETGSLNLGTESTITTIINTAASNSNVNLADGASNTAATALAHVNTAVQQAANIESTDASVALNNIIKAQAVAQGLLASTLSEGSTLSATELDAAISNAEVKEIQPDLKVEGDPFLIATTPADNTGSVPAVTKLQFTFNESVTAQTGGQIVLHSVETEDVPAADPIVIDVTNTLYVSVKDNVVLVDPKVNLGVLTSYYVTITEGAFADKDGNSFAGISDDSTLNFTTTIKNTVIGTEGDDSSLAGTLGNDTINGLGGSDIINASAGNDTVEGGSGEDWIDGELGDDVLSGGDGLDYISGGAGNDKLDGGEGDDTLSDSSGNNILDGGLGDDTLSSSYGDGVSLLNGGAGNDRLDADMGDTLTGDEGADIFSVRPSDIWADSSQPAIITDFNVDEDQLDISALIDEYTSLVDYAGGNPFDPSLGYLSLVQSGNDTLLQLDLDGASGDSYAPENYIQLSGVQASTLTAESFSPSFDLIVQGGTAA